MLFGQYQATGARYRGHKHADSAEWRAVCMAPCRRRYPHGPVADAAGTALHGRASPAWPCTLLPRCGSAHIIAEVRLRTLGKPHVQFHAGMGAYRSSPRHPPCRPARCLQGAERRVQTSLAWSHTPGERKYGVDPRSRSLPRRAVRHPKHRCRQRRGSTPLWLAAQVAMPWSSQTLASS